MAEAGASPSLLVTGVSGFDAVLGGGLLRPGTYLLTGLAGTGKTVLSNQIVYNAARRGETVVYATALAETHDRMISHISGLSFFDRNLVATRVHYVSLYEQIIEYGLSDLKDTVRRLVRDRQATIFVLDGLAAIRDLVIADAGSYRRFLHELNAQLVHLGLISLFVSDAEDQAPSLDRSTPAETIVDGLIWLRDRSYDLRDERELRVRKLRGRPYLRGGHFFRIDTDGVTVFPRVETMMRGSATTIAATPDRVSTGIEGLDTMLGGGLVGGTTTIVAGEPGVGRTLTSLSFLTAGANAGERCMYYGFRETPARLLEAADAVGLPLRQHVEANRITMRWRSPNENIPDELAHDIVSLVIRNQIERLVIDDFSHFQETALYPERIPALFAALTGALRQAGVTTMLTMVVSDVTSSNPRVILPAISTIAETIVVLRYVESERALSRLVSVLKSHASWHDARLHQLEITGRGLFVRPFSSSEGHSSDESRRPGIERPADLPPESPPTTREGPTETTASESDADTQGGG
jgi:circadian clock protein KaiC